MIKCKQVFQPPTAPTSCFLNPKVTRHISTANGVVSGVETLQKGIQLLQKEREIEMPQLEGQLLLLHALQNRYKTRLELTSQLPKLQLQVAEYNHFMDLIARYS
jgi:hypothetical protein